jgi:hypothetical protein
MRAMLGPDCRIGVSHVMPEKGAAVLVIWRNSPVRFAGLNTQIEDVLSFANAIKRSSYHAAFHRRVCR